MRREPGEIFIMCKECNGYICSDEGTDDKLIACPYKCETIGGVLYMRNPPPRKNWQ